MPTASSLNFGKPVIFDTDHTCACRDTQLLTKVADDVIETRLTPWQPMV